MMSHAPPPLVKPSIAADIRVANRVFPQSRCAGKLTIQWDESQPTLYAFTYNNDDCQIHLTGSNTRKLTPDRLCNVVVHEAGHKAGLPHSKNPRSIMFSDPVHVVYKPCWSMYFRKVPGWDFF